jgi:predicted DNA-binding protein
MSEQMIKRTFTLDEKQAERLKALSERTRVPASVYIREGLDRVLDLAEKQQRSIEAATQRVDPED